MTVPAVPDASDAGDPRAARGASGASAPGGTSSARHDANDEDYEEDYGALRTGAGAVPLARDVLEISGPDAVAYLQGQCSQDVAAMAVGRTVDALLLSPQGKLDALVRVTRAGDDVLVVDVDGGYGDAVLARLTRFKLRVKADIAPLDWRCVALRGPDAAARAREPAAAGTSLRVPYDWAGVVGVDLLGAAPEVPPGVRACGREAWASLRVEAGIPVMGAELDERTIAAEADLLERCVSFTKGCYTGQELIARLDARGNKVARRLRGLVVERSALERLDATRTGTAGAGTARAGIARAGMDGRARLVSLIGSATEVLVGEKVVGRVTSVAWSPDLDTVVAIGYLHRDVGVPGPVTLRTPGHVGGGVVSAEARALPLVRSALG